jgi:hypothetical protein
MRPWIVAATLLLPLPLAAQRSSVTRNAVTRDSQAVADVATRWITATMSRDYGHAAALADPAQAMPLRIALVHLVAQRAESERRMRAMRDSIEAQLAKARTRADTNRVLRSRSHGDGVLRRVSTDTQVVRRARIDTAAARVHGTKVLTALRGRPTLASLLAMPDTAFLAVVLAGVDDAVWERMGRDDPQLDSIDRSPPRPEDLPRIHIVDVVIEGDSVAHVLVRPTLPSGEEMFEWGGDDEVGMMSTQLLQLRRRPGGWRVRLGEEQRRHIDTAVMMSSIRRELERQPRDGSR